MRTIGNILWFVLGGFLMGLGWWLAGLLCAITIVGLPWAKACFVIGQFAFLPFGKEAVDRAVLTGVEDIGTGVLGTLGNVIWFVFAGIWLAIGHLTSALCCFVTIIGIPFGIQHIKLAALALAPVGKTIVAKNAARVGL
ncbi:MAG: YccF domain-containing protein [Pseudomonadota bacterium]